MRARASRLHAGVAARAFLATFGVVLCVVAATFVVATAAARRGADEAARQELEQAADLTAQLLAGRGRSLAGGARVFVQGPYFRALVAERSRDNILDQAFEAATQLEADWVFITDERGRLVAKSDEPGAFGDDLGTLPLVAGALDGGVVTGFGASRDTLLFQAVAVPIVVPGAAPVGVLVATRIVDAQLARDVRAATGADVVFYTLAPDGAARASAATLPPDAARAVIARAVGAGGAVGGAAGPAASPLVVAAGTTYVTQRAALATAGGAVVGGYVVLRAREATPREITGVRRALLTATGLGVLLALGVARAAARRVSRPALALAAAARHAVHDDYEAAARDAADASARGPVGELAPLAAAVGALIAELRDRRRIADIVASTARRADAAREPAERPVHGAAASARRAVVRRAGPSVVSAPRPAPRIGAVPVPGDVLASRYAIEAEVGAGGIGIVYRALDLAVGVHVAVKVLRPEVAADPQATERLAHELRLARRVAHRNVVRTHALGESGGVSFITMEYVDGPSLAAVLRARAPLPEAEVLAVATQLARALEAAHAQGVTHGDLKPANLLLGRDGLLKVADFGVAALVHHDAGGPPHDADEVRGPRQLAGAIVGTPEYMAPEVLLGATPDVRADLYSIGVVLQECVTGATSYQADTPRAFLAAKLEPRVPAAPARPRDGAAPRTLAELVAWLTAADRDARPASATVLLTALERLA